MAVLGAVLVAETLFVVCALGVSPALLAGLDERLLFQFNSDAAVTTARAFSLVEEEPRTPAVVLLGSSALREAIPNGSQLSAALSRQAGQPLRAHDLALAAATPMEIVALADRVSGHAHGVLVVGAGPAQLSRTADRLSAVTATLRLGWQSPLYLDELRRADIETPPLTGVYFWDNIHFLANLGQHIVGKLTIDPLGPYRSHPFLHREATPSVLRRHGAALRKTMQKAPIDFLRQVEIYARTLGPLIRGGRWRVLFVEEPRHPWLDRQRWFSWRSRGYRAAMREMCRRIKAGYWNPRKQGVLQPDDFADALHLNSEAAMRRFSEALAAQVVASLPNPAQKSEP